MAGLDVGQHFIHVQIAIAARRLVQRFSGLNPQLLQPPM